MGLIVNALRQLVEQGELEVELPKRPAVNSVQLVSRPPISSSSEPGVNTGSFSAIQAQELFREAPESPQTLVVDISDSSSVEIVDAKTADISELETFDSLVEQVDTQLGSTELVETDRRITASEAVDRRAAWPETDAAPEEATNLDQASIDSLEREELEAESSPAEVVADNVEHQLNELDESLNAVTSDEPSNAVTGDEPLVEDAIDTLRDDVVIDSPLVPAADDGPLIDDAQEDQPGGAFVEEQQYEPEATVDELLNDEVQEDQPNEVFVEEQQQYEPEATVDEPLNDEVQEDQPGEVFVEEQQQYEPEATVDEPLNDEVQEDQPGEVLVEEQPYEITDVEPLTDDGQECQLNDDAFDQQILEEISAENEHYRPVMDAWAELPSVEEASIPSNAHEESVAASPDELVEVAEQGDEGEVDEEATPTFIVGESEFDGSMSGHFSTESIDPEEELPTLETPSASVLGESEFERTIKHLLADSRTRKPFEMLRVGIEQTIPNDVPTSILLVSLDAPRRSADVVATLATLVAEGAAEPILVVDGSFPGRTLSAKFEAADSGLVELLDQTVESREAVRQTSTEALHLLPAGGGVVVEGIKEVSASFDALANLIASWKLKYQHVFIDGGCVDSETAQQLTRYCDATFLLVELGQDETDATSDAVETLRSSGGRVLGCIVDDMGETA